MITLATDIAIIEAGRILLIQEAETGLWNLPGGKVEPGESVAQAAVREAREETGLEARLTRLVGIYSLPRLRRGDLHVVLFAAEPAGGAPMRGTDPEVLDARYFHPDELPDALVWWHRQRILDALHGVGGSLAWFQDAAWSVARQAGQPFGSWTIHPGPEHETLDVGGK